MSHKVTVNGVTYEIPDGEVLVILGEKITVGASVHQGGVRENKIVVELHGSPLAVYSSSHVEVSGDCGKIDTQGAVTVSGSCNGKIDTKGAVSIGGDCVGKIDTQGAVTVRGNHQGKIDTMGAVRVGSLDK